MHQESYDEMSRLVTTYLRTEQSLRVLDIGSCDVNGTYKPLFSNKNWTYEGADMQAGPNVDHVLLDPYRWSFEDETFDVVISGQTFEHIKYFWLVWKEMVRILRIGGLVFLIAPSRGIEHCYPLDCWRFYRDGFEALGQLENLEVIEVGTRLNGTWGDTVGVFRKNTRTKTAGLYGAPTVKGIGFHKPLKIREADYAVSYNTLVADWIIYHHESIVFEKVQWMGIKVRKNTLDCWIYQEILWEIKPEVLVEIGSYDGGSTLYFCHLFDIIGKGTVVSVDLERSYFKIKHPRLIEMTGDCGDPSFASKIADFCTGKSVLVIHDADHSKDAVLRDLQLYADIVSPGSYFIVEDGIVDVFDPNTYPQLGWERPGPLVAIKEFLKKDDRFVIDKCRERYLITYNPCGFLKRVK